MKKAFVFDYDDTLATTKCRILVRSKGNVAFGNNKIVKKLTPSEYNTYKIKDDCYYDFSEFSSPDFIHNANPTKLIELAKEVYDEGHNVFVITARSDDVSSAIASFLAGFDIKPVSIHCVGGPVEDESKVDIALEKRKVLETIKEIHDLVFYYDDCPKNCDAARKITSVKVYLQ
jgi:hydroxymethylpyrimidine pyrophosphatase-like HAD family hydrolase